MSLDSTNSWKAFSALWKHFPCKKLSRCLKKWWSIGKRWGEIWQMKQDFVAQFVQLLKHWLCRRIGPFLLINANLRRGCSQYISLILLSILLRCYGFTEIQKAVVDQMGSRPPNSDLDFLWCKFCFGKCFGAAAWSHHTKLGIASCCIKSTFCCLSQSDQEMLHCCFIE